MSKYDVVSVGECLIDFAPLPEADPNKIAFTGAPGGSTPNAMACVARLGGKAAFIGKIGNDIFGSLFCDVLMKSGVDIDGMVITKAHPTTLAFVALDENGEREFSFYRDRTADCMLEKGEINETMVRSARIFHFASVSLSAQPAADATLASARDAKDVGCKVAMDVNLREMLWDSLDRAKIMIREGLKIADYVKVSEEELEFLTDYSDEKEGIAKLKEQFPNIRVLAVTRGKNGSALQIDSHYISADGYKIKAVDTTGCGDAFWGAFLYLAAKLILEPDAATEQQMRDALAFCNAAGALVALKKGAIPSMPALDEVNAFIAEHK